jgi:hypothetical protein
MEYWNGEGSVSTALVLPAVCLRPAPEYSGSRLQHIAALGKTAPALIVAHLPTIYWQLLK